VSPGVVLAPGRASWSVRASNTAGAGPWSGAARFHGARREDSFDRNRDAHRRGDVFDGNGTIALGGTASDDVAVTQVTWTNDRGGSGTGVGHFVLDDRSSRSLASGTERDYRHRS
jgi:hypothetical protein